MTTAHVGSRAEWRAARRELLVREKEATRAADLLAAQRRSLPIVPIEREYVFDGPDGKASLPDLFDGRRQLIVYHFMFDPSWEEGCPHCSYLVDHFGHLEHLHARDTSLVVVSRAPWSRIEPFKARMGWTFPWFSTSADSFSADFDPAQDEVGAPVEYSEWGGLLVFLRDDDLIHHTYSTTARGLDHLHGTYNLLDLTPLGRNEDPRFPMSWIRHHDRYDADRNGGTR